MERKGFNVSELSKIKLKMILFSTDLDCNWAAQLDQRTWDMRTFACHINRAFSVLRRPCGFGANPVRLFSLLRAKSYLWVKEVWTWCICIYKKGAVHGHSVFFASWSVPLGSLMWSRKERPEYAWCVSEYMASFVRSLHILKHSILCWQCSLA